MTAVQTQKAPKTGSCQRTRQMDHETSDSAESPTATELTTDLETTTSDTIGLLVQLAKSHEPICTEASKMTAPESPRANQASKVA